MPKNFDFWKISISENFRLLEISISETFRLLKIRFLYNLDFWKLKIFAKFRFSNFSAMKKRVFRIKMSIFTKKRAFWYFLSKMAKIDCFLILSQCRPKMVFLQFSGRSFIEKNNIFIDANTPPLEQAYNFSVSPTILISRLY